MAMEQLYRIFIDHVPIKTSIHKDLSIATFDDTRGCYHPSNGDQVLEARRLVESWQDLGGSVSNVSDS